MLLFVGEETGKPRKKTLESKARTNNKLNGAKYSMTLCRNKTQATLVWGKHHPSSHQKYRNLNLRWACWISPGVAFFNSLIHEGGCQGSIFHNNYCLLESIPTLFSTPTGKVIAYFQFHWKRGEYLLRSTCCLILNWHIIWWQKLSETSKLGDWPEAEYSNK